MRKRRAVEIQLPDLVACAAAGVSDGEGDVIPVNGQGGIGEPRIRQTESEGVQRRNFAVHIGSAVLLLIVVKRGQVGGSHREGCAEASGGNGAPVQEVSQRIAALFARVPSFNDCRGLFVNLRDGYRRAGGWISCRGERPCRSPV